ncbi:MAG: xanthine dehydrogenase family protein subunit M [Candidatus Aminicenantes bacterium]|nr:MAG: xanthine dehydrogenase family protein subunit M [Candidatus Aminicenantes bacterium]
MKNFVHIKPQNVKEASQLLGDNWKDVLPYAGGTDLLGLMKDGIEAPEKLIDLKALPGMNKITYTPGRGLKIGPLVTIAEIAEHELINQKYAVLAQAAKEVASPQLRNQGTIGGNICQRPRCWYFRGDFHCLRKGGDMCYAVEGENKYHCIIGGGPCFIVHPSDTAVALLALDASVTVFSGKKSRQITLKDFFVLPEKVVTRENILKPGDIITEIQVPDVPPGIRSGYLKFKEREVWDFASVSVAAVLQIQQDTVKSARVVLGGVAPMPWLEKHVSGQLTGMSINSKNLEQIAASALKDAETLEQNEYKVPLARNWIKRLISNLL